MEDGQQIELTNRGSQRWGMASLNGNTLEVSPEGDVEVDMGDIRSFRSTVTIIEDGREQELWIGSVKTNGNLTLRTPDSNESMHFIKTT